MEYMILIYGDADAGVMRGGSELHPASSASTVRMRGGKVLTMDGPFAETKEQLAQLLLFPIPRNVRTCKPVCSRLPFHCTAHDGIAVAQMQTPNLVGLGV